MVSFLFLPQWHTNSTAFLTDCLVFASSLSVYFTGVDFKIKTVELRRKRKLGYRFLVSGALHPVTTVCVQQSTRSSNTINRRAGGLSCVSSPPLVQVK